MARDGRFGRKVRQAAPQRARAVVRSLDARLVEERPEPTRVPRMWSSSSIAERCGWSRMHVYRLYQSGRLRGFRVLGTIRFLEDDVVRLLREEGVPIQENSP